MSLHARNFPPSPRRKKKPQAGNGIKLGVILNLLLFAGALFYIINLRISFNQETEELSREASRIRSRVYKLNRDISHLRMRKEKLSRWPHINRMIRKFKLGLRSPRPYQVKRLVIIRHQRKNDEKKLRTVATSTHPNRSIQPVSD